MKDNDMNELELIICAKHSNEMTMTIRTMHLCREIAEYLL